MRAEQKYLSLLLALFMQQKAPKYYRLLQNSSMIVNGRKNNQSDQSAVSPEKLTQSIVKNNHFVYIDINSENGLCEMECINPEDADLDAEALAGNNYVCAINRLPLQSQKTIDYIYKLQEAKKQKQKFKELLRDQICATVMKRKQKYVKKERKHKFLTKSESKSNCQNQLDSSLPNKPQKLLPRNRNLSLNIHASENTVLSPMKTPDRCNVVLYRGMETKHLKEYLEQREIQEINEKILAKEKLLIQKYGLTNKFESTTKQKSHIIRRHGKVYLPQIRSAGKFAF